ncbi:transcription factor RelB isoform X2 [Austrofundulus limnaeus]|nr:PREDICTED: transcription factor RelB-like isoform X2 [Austrofundulus limnaeus]
MSSFHPLHVASSDRGRASSCLLAQKSPVSTQSQGGTEMLEKILENPRLVVVEEPKDRGMRFRYQCEGRSAGSIMGASSTDNNKTQPTIEIQGPIDGLKKATVTVSLVSKDVPHRPHPHCLVGKDCPVDSGICVVSINPHANRSHSFANLGIQCVRRKELDVSLQKRRSQNIDPFQTGFSKGIEDIDMNSVRLCFQCELEWEDGRKDSLSPVISKPIYDKKATTTSELKIYNLNTYRGTCRGKTEVYMLCDKVQKDDIEILFRLGSWKANGEFAQTDVHRQVAIVFKTPPYEDQSVTEDVEVNVVLRRISDQMESEPVSFTYTPVCLDPYGVKRKGTKKNNMLTSEKSCGTETTPPLPSFFHQTPNVMSSGENQLEKYPQGVCLDEVIINQLLELPELLNALSDSSLPCTPGLDTSAIFDDLDMSFNQNFSNFQQDLAHINDIQFNMLVNENQNPQAERQDGVLQVKTEEEQ